jgi:U3 small nucleolar RNA-associated protein 12
MKSSIAVGYSTGQINILNYISKNLIATLHGHSSAISCLVDIGSQQNLSTRGSAESMYLLASGGCDCDIILWDLVSLNAICKLRGHKDAVTDITLINSGNRRFLVSVSKDTLLKVWCLESESCVQTIVGE